MSNNNLFYQFAAGQPQNPIDHLKNLLNESQKDLSKENHPKFRRRLELKIKNLTDFLNFIEDAKPGFRVLYKTNVGTDENHIGVLAIIFAITIIPEKILEGEFKHKILNNLYKEDKIVQKSDIFKVTRIPNIYMWYQQGEITNEAFGRVQHETLKGFVAFTD